MGEPEQQTTSRPLAYQLWRINYQRKDAAMGALTMCISVSLSALSVHYIIRRLCNQRQEALIGALIMCLSTLSSQYLVQNIYSQKKISDELKPLLLPLVGMFAIIAWVIGFNFYLDGLEGSGQSQLSGRNKGLIYGLGAANVSLATIIICPWINEETSFAVKVWPVYIAMVIAILE